MNILGKNWEYIVELIIKGVLRKGWRMRGLERGLVNPRKVTHGYHGSIEDSNHERYEMKVTNIVDLDLCLWSKLRILLLRFSSYFLLNLPVLLTSRLLLSSFKINKLTLLSRSLRLPLLPSFFR